MGSNEKDRPHVNKDGSLTKSSGTGPLKEYTVRKFQPVDSAELESRGIVPEGGLRWDAEYLKTIRYRKFGPEQRQIFLEKLAETGRIKVAAIHAGVLPSCIERHRTEDPSLEEETQLALTMYHEQTVALITAQARAGMHDIRYDKEGQVVARRVTYEQQLRMRLLERADSDYKQVQKSEISVQGGAVLLPTPLESLDDWNAITAKYISGGSSEASPSLPGPSGSGRTANEVSGALADGRVIKRGGSEPSIDTEGTESKEE